MQKRSNFHFRYPPNIHTLDLATMVNMYRSRGEPQKAPPGEFLACSISQKLMKEGKWWFGLFYSQDIWDELLTKGSEGFPLTDIELTVLGHVYMSEDEVPHREFVEKNAGITEKTSLSYRKRSSGVWLSF